MDKFEFDKNKKPELMNVMINDIAFTFNPISYSVKKTCEKFINKQKNFIERLNDNTLIQEEKVDIIYDSCDLVNETINDILGEGAYEKIFENRTISIEENQRLISFIFQKIKDYTEQTIQSGIDDEHINRTMS